MRPYVGRYDFLLSKLAVSCSKDGILYCELAGAPTVFSRGSSDRITAPTSSGAEFAPLRGRIRTWAPRHGCPSVTPSSGYHHRVLPAETFLKCAKYLAARISHFYQIRIRATHSFIFVRCGKAIAGKKQHGRGSRRAFLSPGNRT